jgi:hypothetical protein
MINFHKFFNFSNPIHRSMLITQNFRQAIVDYTHLLNKKYPEKTILEMIATRYSLSHFERSIIYRGITTEEKAEKRKSRFVISKKLTRQVLHIDLFNVLYTLAAYLRGFPVFISNDGLLRDASESHGSGEWEVHMAKGLELLMGDLDGLKLIKAVFYVDNPLEHYQVILEKLNVLSNGLITEIKIISDPSPDHLMIDAKDGILATSDSTIIDKSSLPVFDLPRAVLEFHFEPKLLRLNQITI